MKRTFEEENRITRCRKIMKSWKEEEKRIYSRDFLLFGVRRELCEFTHDISKYQDIITELINTANLELQNNGSKIKVGNMIVFLESISKIQLPCVDTLVTNFLTKEERFTTPYLELIFKHWPQHSSLFHTSADRADDLWNKLNEAISGSDDVTAQKIRCYIRDNASNYNWDCLRQSWQD